MTMTEQKFISPCFVMYGKQEIKGLKLGDDTVPF